MVALAVTGCGARTVTFGSSSDRSRDNGHAPRERGSAIQSEYLMRAQSVSRIQSGQTAATRVVV
jgi:hypothetical protein